MRLYRYNALHLRERAEHLWSYGTFIAVCRKRKPYVQYFMINDLFVEMQFDPDSIKMLGLIAFDSGERFERMLDAIPLDKLLDPDLK